MEGQCARALARRRADLARARHRAAGCRREPAGRWLRAGGASGWRAHLQQCFRACLRGFRQRRRASRDGGRPEPLVRRPQGGSYRARRYRSPRARADPCADARRALVGVSGWDRDWPIRRASTCASMPARWIFRTRFMRAMRASICASRRVVVGLENAQMQLGAGTLAGQLALRRDGASASTCRAGSIWRMCRTVRPRVGRHDGAYGIHLHGPERAGACGRACGRR